MVSSPPSLQFEWATGLPVGFKALTTTRTGGVSQGAYTSFNLAQHVGDDPSAVAANRARLREQLGLPSEPCWLNQVHGVAVADADCVYSEPPEADASFSRAGQAVCAVLTADCLPVVFAAGNGEMACAHAGWRGLLNGVLLETLKHFSASAAAIYVWLGPAIGPASFEVGAEVRQAFVELWTHIDAELISGCFSPQADGKYLADIYALARLQLRAAGIVAISGGEADTLAQSSRYFSYRAEAQTGRIATLVWRASAD